MTTFNVIDLFSGCGGLSVGFAKAGFNILAGIDFWSVALETFKHNFPNALVKCEDLSKYSPHLLDLKDKVDIIIGGPPCQGFSIAGHRFIDDPRNQLYKGFVRFVKELHPKAFLMENVPNLISIGKGVIKESILKDFLDLGYDVQYSIMTASDFGVPQKRRRVFFVGIDKSLLKNDKVFRFPLPQCGPNLAPYVTTKEAISDLDFLKDDDFGCNSMKYKLSPQSSYQKKMRMNSTLLYNHCAARHSEKVRSIISMVPDGKNYKVLPIELQKTRNVNIAWTRMCSSQPCFTIDTGHNHHFHYRANRVPTPREAARIQSFPDDFVFLGTTTSQLKQVGNAVPPLLAEVIANQIKLFLEEVS